METSSSSSLKEEGLRLLKAGQVDDAIETLKRAARADPEDARTHCYLGAAYNQKHDKLHAIAEFEECLRLEETPKAYYNLGRIYESVHRVDEAVRQYRMAVELDPDYSPATQALQKLHSRFESEHPEQHAPPDQDSPSAAEPHSAGEAADSPRHSWTDWLRRK